MLVELEWQTRKKRIGTKLHSLNPPWQIIPWREGLDVSKLGCNAATEYSTENGPADGIPIVKHAATAQAPVLTAEEWVNRAMEALAVKQKFTTEQMQWLSLVREQLIKNLTIDEDDFDNTPLLQGRGGVARARQVFGELNSLAAQLNEGVAT